MVVKRMIIISLIISLLLLIPFIAMQFSNEVNWSPLDFVVIGLLLFGNGLLADIAFRKIRNKTFRIIVPIVLLMVLFLVWAELAVGIFGTHWAGN